MSDIIKTNLKNLNNDLNLIEINDNQDWKDLRDHKDSKIYAMALDNYYFASRAAENGALGVFIDPFNIDNIKRAVKDVTKHGAMIILYFDIKSIPLYLKETNEVLLNEIANVLLDVREMTDNIGLGFKFDDESQAEEILYVIKSMYDFPLFVEGYESEDIEYLIK